MFFLSGDFFKDKGSRSPSSIICFIKRFKTEKFKPSYEATLKYSKEAGIIWEKYPN